MLDSAKSLNLNREMCVNFGRVSQGLVAAAVGTHEHSISVNGLGGRAANERPTAGTARHEPLADYLIKRPPDVILVLVIGLALCSALRSVRAALLCSCTWRAGLLVRLPERVIAMRCATRVLPSNAPLQSQLNLPELPPPRRGPLANDD